MSREIRTSIYMLDLLAPANNTGWSVDTFYFHSDELTEHSTEALQAELEAMAVEGLLTKTGAEGSRYWATKKGQVTRQKHLAQAGLLAKPLADQRSHSLDDLILAVVASNRVDPFSGSDGIPIDALPIYFHEFSDEEIIAAKDTLAKSGLIDDSAFFPRRSISITGRGLQKYRTDSRFRLVLGGNEGILRLLTPAERDTRFSNLGFDIGLQSNLEQRWIEMLACARSEAYLAAVIMLGSILEGALLAKLRANVALAMTAAKAPKDRGGKVKPIDEWTLDEYITVATELSYLPKSVEKHSHELRDTRNLVHPRKQVSERIVVDESLFRISKEVAETVIDALSELPPVANHSVGSSVRKMADR